MTTSRTPALYFSVTQLKIGPFFLNEIANEKSHILRLVTRYLFSGQLVNSMDATQAYYAGTIP